MTCFRYQALRSVPRDAGLSVGVGDEGGAPNVSSNRQPLELLVQGIEKAGYMPEKDIAFCIDPASSEFFKDGKYHLQTEKRELTAGEMTAYYTDLIRDFPIVLLEGGLAEDDWAGWIILHGALGDKIELVSGDIFVTNVKYTAGGMKL